MTRGTVQAGNRAGKTGRYLHTSHVNHCNEQRRNAQLELQQAQRELGEALAAVASIGENIAENIEVPVARAWTPDPSWDMDEDVRRRFKTGPGRGANPEQVFWAPLS